ncbi:3-methyl-2-oxobutanoate hydroxymethyltransferase [Sphingobacterium spiritivorum ATCC 33300]|uniref:3-methyl-2-oxobutanoate hydroxymethyltransferase n=3 Tax=Sphingobacterium spiritivorum TaxID=258 RepID=D7VMF5_SPHSI|nr:3-methyl-2-oxobutanoate hydroxymethyltransferase [Sphingobacterium spiritivorum]EEI89969.1 3-methyl-2-oxobutanoate hydroxymethyltransferase [Sphingobacterium spiritivorum ATCC 33300]EFK58160.1 3-methyl-2-oxobutanoate hydroxymethyltransferase [Sphingobacterium spiritivorum ATCC 33861]QQS94881.1 3-methyl-2-oxobutanoate hydroxymethyltransferase [Sphingobacterium spiritivorum]QQT34586.1 3-methyl-2-oxobutanoate hydroxymethyltransferase [Sphingobacterium spiritivorum]WQD35465.1 3-methyl-2-oxobuta
MSVNKEITRITTSTIQELKNRKEKIAMLTGYDYSIARALDEGGVEIILVGDSAANVFAGYETTLPMTLDNMIYHASAVVRGTKRAMVVVDLPFGAYQGDINDAYKAAVRVMKESGAHALKLEGGVEIIENIRKIVETGIPVCGHLGLTPQSIYKFGNFGVRAKEEAEAEKLKTDALALQEAGCFAVVLEKIPAKLAAEVSASLHIPTIGIGAGNGCDGQVLVVNDMLGLTKGFKPKFLRQYLNLYEEMTKAFGQYVADVKAVNYPNENEQY